MDLSTMRARLRRDLHDEDASNYRWTDNELDRHIDRAVREFSWAVPREVKATLTTTAGSRELSLATLADRITIEAVEYPVGQYPPSYVRFSTWAEALTLLVDAAPSGGQTVYVYYGRLHTLDASSSTVPPRLEDLVATGAGGYAALEWASYATNRVNVGGADTGRDYLAWGRERLAAFHESLAREGRRNAMRARRLYAPAEPRPSQTNDWGP